LVFRQAARDRHIHVIEHQGGAIMNKFTPLTSAALAALLALAMNGASAAGDSGNAMSSGSNQLSKDQQQQFQKLDTNSDGRISQDEAKADPQLEQQFSSADSNHDNAVDQGEFAQFEAQSQGSQGQSQSQ
jgi:hypothetical protein